MTPFMRWQEMKLDMEKPSSNFLRDTLVLYPKDNRQGLSHLAQIPQDTAFSIN